MDDRELWISVFRECMAHEPATESTRFPGEDKTKAGWAMMMADKAIKRAPADKETAHV